MKDKDQTQVSIGLVAGKANSTVDKLEVAKTTLDTKIDRTKSDVMLELTANSLILDAKIENVNTKVDKISNVKRYDGQFISSTNNGTNTKWNYFSNDIVINNSNLSIGTQALARTNGYVVTSFSNDYCRAMIALPDGKILLAGDSNNLITLIQLTSEGSVDTTFGQNSNGIITTNLSNTMTDVGINLAVQSDGKILLAGQTDGKYVLARFTKNGILDKIILDGPIFDNSTQSNGRSVVVMPDDKILLCGDWFDSTKNGYFLVRYNRNGTLDDTFGSNKSGYILGDYLTPLSIVINTTNIYLAGSYYNSVIDNTNPQVISFNMDGTVNMNFGTNGVYTNSNIFGTIRHIKVSSDNNLIICGGSFVGSNNNILLSKILNSGIIDTTFGTNGVVTTDLGSNDFMFRLDIDLNGKILLAGHTNKNGNADLFVARYDTKGILDTSFATNGYLIRNMYGGVDVLRGLSVLADQKILIAGHYATSTNSTYNDINFIISKYDSNCKNLDTTFGSVTTTGRSGTFLINVSYNIFTNVNTYSDGKILLTGSSNYNNLMIKYSNDTKDTTFGSNGLVISDLGGREVCMDSVIRDNQCYFVGNNATSIFVARYNTNGTLDTSFGPTNKGYVYATVGTANIGFSLDFCSDNSLIISGSADDKAILIKYSKDGILDKSFGTNGIVVTPFNTRMTTELFDALNALTPLAKITSRPLYPCKIAVLNDNSIICAMTVFDKITIAKYTANGTLDKLFASNGILMFNKISNIDIVRSIKLLSDQSIIIGGLTDNKVFLIKLNSNGVVDKKFGTDGIQITNLGTTGTIVPTFGYNAYLSHNFSMSIQYDDYIVVSGFIRTESNSNISYLARYNNMGMLDTTFGSNLTGINTFTLIENYIIYFRSVIIRNDGKIMIGGTIGLSSGNNYSNTVFVLLCFQPDGKLDNKFGVKTISNSAFGNFALNANTTGSSNTAVGTNSLSKNQTGSNNTAIGYNSFLSTTTYTNSTAIGYNAQVSASNQIQLGDTNVTSVNTSGTISTSTKVKASGGFVLPRLTSTQRNSLPNKEDGLMILGDDNKIYVWISNTGTWKSIALV